MICRRAKLINIKMNDRHWENRIMNYTEKIRSNFNKLSEQERKTLNLVMKDCDLCWCLEVNWSTWPSTIFDCVPSSSPTIWHRWQSWAWGAQSTSLWHSNMNSINTINQRCFECVLLCVHECVYRGCRNISTNKQKQQSWKQKKIQQ